MSLEPDMRRVVAMGPRIRMQFHEKKTRKPVFKGFFVPSAWTDSTYFDWRALADPSQSDFPLMKKAVALGLYHPPTEHDEPYGISFTWRRTEAGDALAAIQPQPGSIQEQERLRS